MKKQIMVLVVTVIIIAVVLCGCRAANKVPGVSAAESAAASVLPTLQPTPLPTITRNTTGTGMSSMPITSMSPPATTKTK